MSTLPFDCPRCGQPTDARFYGPCDTCREQLRATMLNERREVEVAAFEPKMNVVPNQVAIKE
jgi:hypothetical protein